MKWLGNSYHDHQKQVGQSMTRKINEDVSIGYKSARAGHLAELARQAGISRPEDIRDSWLVGACWLMVWAIGVVLVVREWVR